MLYIFIFDYNVILSNKHSIYHTFAKKYIPNYYFHLL